ncbi:acyltransferase [Bacteroides xylanisolvens]|jgi:acetyltransferase-like isoleucine patch superfamily enzyme|uniref:acyltransferase n=1 Tax=Bacteroides xylanisolvens TaxID=371601 RepID=UPI001C39267F|nr:acyltransferase [Bacteroides xylanisolvens]MBV4223335.1 acyltransferase [Bacteroides xylanisolvens]
MGQNRLKQIVHNSFSILLYLRRYIQYLIYNKSFRSFGHRSFIIKPLHLNGLSNILIGDNVTINYKTWLAALPLTGEKECSLQIKDGAIIGHFNHIYATKRILIEENVMTADKVYISDNLHGYEDIDVPIRDQPIVQNKEVVIGRDSWLGENVCVLGAKIGRHCVIGANSVVTKDIPDYCIAVGIPARIIKRYCFDSQTWRRTDEQGNFIY